VYIFFGFACVIFSFISLEVPLTELKVTEKEVASRIILLHGIKASQR